MLKFAIVGNIAAGKSAVEKILTDKKFIVYDTDKLSHDILDALQQEVINAFSDENITENGLISRKKLGETVFSDNEKKLKLENIIYPKLKQKLYEIFEKHKNEKYIFVSVPLLFEAGWEGMFDKILFVKADDELRLKRLMQRNSLSKDAAMRRMLAQKSQETKEKTVDFIICNNDDILNLQKQVDEFIILLEDME